LFTLFHGPHWTLLGYQVDAASVPPPRSGLRIHTIGAGGDLLDTDGHVYGAYGLSPEQWVLIRPDGYVAAVLDTADLGVIESYLDTMGVHAPR
jgi:hypothetical protein